MFSLIRKNAHNLRWKHIYWINSSMRVEKVMWLCAMRRDNLTNQQTDLVHSIYKMSWSFWNTWGRSVIKVFLYNCLTRLCSQTAAILLRAQWQHLLCYACSLYTHNIYHIKYYIQVASSIFLVIFSARVYQEVTILFSLTRWMDSVFY